MTFDGLVAALAWPFGSTLMLLWGLAAVIPIIIHLWNRRRYNEVAWAAMTYLLAAVRKNARRIRIEQLLLLAIRTLILLLLAAALADPIVPYLSALGGGLGGTGRTHWVLVVDGSYSMDYREDQQSRFDIAQRLASQLVDEASLGDGFTLLLMADPPQVVVREPAFAAKDVRDEIENLQMTHGGADLTATLAEVEKILQSAQEKHARRLKAQKICLFSDLGRTTWQAVNSPSCRRRIDRLAGKASLVLFDLGDESRQNLAISHLAAGEPLATIARRVSFDVELQNFGTRDQKQCAVELLIDGHSVDVGKVDVHAGGRANVSLTHHFDAPGEHFVEARLSDDALPVDNHRWLSLPVRSAISVLCVRGKIGAARYVAFALDPATAGEPRVRPETVSESALLELNLNQYDCIFLCNVGQFGRDEASVLYDYVNSGGGLVVFLGDRVKADRYNQELGGEASGKRVLPAMLGQITAHGQYRFDPLEYRHPIVAAFRGYQQTGLLTTPIWKYFKLAPYDPDAAKIALALDNGDPVIVEEPIGRGRSILVATAASTASVDDSSDPWTAISSWPSFPPLVQEMLELAVRGRTQGRNLQVGESLEGSVGSTDPSLVLNVLGPLERDDSQYVSLTVEGAASRWNYGPTRLSGVYEAQFNRLDTPSQLFGVNVDTRESDLERFDIELLPSQISQEFKADTARSPQLPTGKPTPLFQFFLGAVLVLLLVETFLARQFGAASA